MNHHHPLRQLYITLVLCLLPGWRLPAQSLEGAIQPQFLERMRTDLELDAPARAAYNAVTNNKLSDLVLDRDILRAHDTKFTHKIETKGITNQKSSGRCWMFAGLNILRPKVIEAKKMPAFEFSTAYLQFWDKMEKSNLFLEQMIELRERDFTDREWQLLVKWAEGDGGWWNYVVGLVEKYGLVPQDVMPETYASEHTSTMNRVLKTKLCVEAVRIREAADQGAPISDLRKIKEDALSEIYRFLVINLGNPPTSFQWRYEVSGKQAAKPTSTSEASDTDNKSTSETESESGGGRLHTDSVAAESEQEEDRKNLTPFQTYTPITFYREFVGVSLQQYVCLSNDPTNPFFRHFAFGRATNMAELREMDFVNLPAEVLKQVAMQAVLADEPVWFAADVGVDQYGESGIMEDGLYDYATLFGMDLTISKADRIRFGLGASNHAMVFTGVDVQDGKPHKWLVENSWGSEKGDGGRWILYDGWFDQNVYMVIVPEAFVSEELLAIFDQPATLLPPWYPGAVGLD